MKKKKNRLIKIKSKSHNNQLNNNHNNIKIMNTNTNTNPKNSSTIQNPSNSYFELVSEIANLTAQVVCNFMRKNVHKDYTLEELKKITDITNKVISFTSRLKNFEIKMQKQLSKEKIQNSQDTPPASNEVNENCKAKVSAKKNRDLQHTHFDSFGHSKSCTKSSSSNYNNTSHSSHLLKTAESS